MYEYTVANYGITAVLPVGRRLSLTGPDVVQCTTKSFIAKTFNHGGFQQRSYKYMNSYPKSYQSHHNPCYDLQATPTRSFLIGCSFTSWTFWTAQAGESVIGNESFLYLRKSRFYKLTQTSQSFVGLYDLTRITYSPLHL